MKTQVAIIGAGPTGLSMAAQLLRNGIDFIILEKNEHTTELSKALVVQARTLELFQELKIAEKALTEGAVTTALNMFYKGRKKAAININGLGEGLSPFPFALSLEQSKTEKLLADYLSEHGKTIQWQCEFSHFEEMDNRIILHYKNGAGQLHQVEASYLVGCDGAGSLLRHQLNLPFEGDTVPKLFYVADVILQSTVISRNELYMFVIKKGFILFFPMQNQGHYRIVGILPGATDLDAPAHFDDIKDYIKKQVAVNVDFQIANWFSTYKVHSRKAASFQKGRCFIAGDAAHIHTPAGGQGMNTGIQDAYNLAWKIAGNLKGQLNEEVLKTYNAERSENARHLLRTTDRLFDLMAGTTSLQNFIRLHILPGFAKLFTQTKEGKKRIFPFLSQTGISYANSALTIKSSVGKVKAGVRMPYFVFGDGKQIFDYLKEPCFKLLFFGKANDRFDGITVKLKIITYRFSEIPSFFEEEKNFYVLLRPDNHISYIGKEIKKCEALFKRILADGTLPVSNIMRVKTL